MNKKELNYLLTMPKKENHETQGGVVIKVLNNNPCFYDDKNKNER